MSKRLKNLSFAFAVSVIGGTAMAQDATTTVDTVVATVGETKITVGDMVILRQNLPQQYRQYPAASLFPGILDQLIDQTLLANSGDGTLSKADELALIQERRTRLARTELVKLLDGKVGEEEIAARYEAEYANAEQGREYNASHILVETKEEADALVSALNNGSDFAALAREKSTGPSGPNGGQLGWFGTGQMVPEFEAAVVAMDVESISEPVQTQFGWHVIRLNDSRLKSAPALEEVRGDIKQALQEEAVRGIIDTLRAGVQIEKIDLGSIDPSVLDTLTLSEE